MTFVLIVNLWNKILFFIKIIRVLEFFYFVQINDILFEINCFHKIKISNKGINKLKIVKKYIKIYKNNNYKAIS